MKIQDMEKDKKVNEVKMESFTLGTIICRFTIPEFIIDEINNDYDNVKNIICNIVNTKIKNEMSSKVAGDAFQNY